ncbi:hypothetical protein HYALB_00012185 [Hymenoscyphus albidus]|uniref:Uncharacterized protein n=1 Tax=Hymenoscyphus albidus TaxID=595503 RepID=A0A9N9Q610_9HELO|nr:hypothetical protein HYALB_00012185 [Hymenoscyphus albidus]
MYPANDKQNEWNCSKQAYNLRYSIPMESLCIPKRIEDRREKNKRNKRKRKSQHQHLVKTMHPNPSMQILPLVVYVQGAGGKEQLFMGLSESV